jgi:hypothetical protein
MKQFLKTSLAVALCCAAWGVIVWMVVRAMANKDTVHLNSEQEAIQALAKRGVNARRTQCVLVKTGSGIWLYMAEYHAEGK